MQTINQYSDQFRGVDRVVVVISDHAPVSLSSGNGPSITGAAQLASALIQSGFYIGALTPVPTFMTTIRTGYHNSIVSNYPLFDGNMKSYDDDNFQAEIQKFFLQNICGCKFYLI